MQKRLITKEKIYGQQRTYLLSFLVFAVCINVGITDFNLPVIAQGLLSSVVAFFTGQSFKNKKKYTDAVLLALSGLVPLAFTYLGVGGPMITLFMIVTVFQIACLIENKKSQVVLLTLSMLSIFACSVLQDAPVSYALSRAMALGFFGFITVRTVDYLLESQHLLKNSFTERLQMSTELEQTRAFQRTLLDSTEYAIIAADNNWIITEFNRAASQMLEYGPEELIGKHTPAIYHDKEQMDERTKEINERYHANIQSGMMTFRYKNKIGIPNSNEWIFITKSGKRLNVWLTLTTLKDAQGKAIGCMAIVHDITAKRLREQQQHTAEAIIANSPSVLFKWNYDKETTLLYVSANVYRLLGYTSLDFTSGRVTYRNLILPEDAEPLFERLKEEVEKGATTLVNEHRVRHRNNSVIWIEEKLFVNRDHTGKIEYIEGICTDITKNKQAQEELKASELRYELAARGSAAGIWDWIDVNQPRLWLSERYFELLGYRYNEIEPYIDTFREMIHPDDLGLVLENMKAHLDNNVPFLSEWRMKTKTGAYKWFSASGQAHRNPEGKAIRMVGSIIDIDYKKTNEELLKRSEERFRLLIESARDIFYNTDSSGRFTYVNEVAVTITEYTIEELLQMRYFDLIREDYKQKVTAFYRNQIGLQTGITLFEFPFVTKSGKTRWVSQHVRMIYENGLVKSSQAIARDITDLKLTQQQLQEYTQTLERTNQELNEFSYVVSHDLKAPLRGVSYLIDWIREEQQPYLTAESTDNFELLKSRLLKMEQFINQLLEYSHAGRKISKTEQIDLRVFIRELVQLLQLGTHINVAIKTVDLQLETDAVLLEQVLSNLVGNAVKYNKSPNPFVEISCEKQDNKLVFSVTDNGPGIEKRHHATIFKMFQTIDTPNGSISSGIGLAIVKKILEEKNELIVLESEPGKGSKFSFTWNIAKLA